MYEQISAFGTEILPKRHDAVGLSVSTAGGSILQKL